MLASTMCARANNCAMVAAVSGKRFGSMIVGAVGQTNHGRHAVRLD